MAKYDVTVRFASSGAGGNIFAILGSVRAEMRKKQLIQAYNDMLFDVQNTGSYDDALSRIRQDIKLIDTDGRY
jgi:hypothetical protein